VALKRLKIDRVVPDALVALQRADECEPVLCAYAGAARLSIMRLPAAPTTRRSATARRHARGRALQAHLAGAVPVTLDLARVATRVAPAARGLSVIDAEGVLVGLQGHDGATLGLGWVSAVDATGARLTVETGVDRARIAVVAIGRERYRVA
jgi:polynucleotide 5'-kinase involved in rRNA processing